MVLAEGLVLVGIGLAAGLMLAVVTGRALGSLLFETSPADPLTFASVTLFLLVVALTATVLPARRASRVEPVAALRSE
jgi:ABC-type antimicrobial peptide transport system permease subunit